MKRFGCLLLAVWLWPVPSPAGEAHAYLPARLTYGGRAYDLNLADQPITAFTRLGSVDLWLHDVQSVAFERGRRLYRIETTHGDVRFADGLTQQLRYYYLDDVRTLSFGDASFERLDLRQTGRVWEPKEHARVAMNDGSLICLDVGGWTLQVRNQAGEWDLPVGALESVRIYYAIEALQNRATVTFPSGSVEHFTFVPRDVYLRATDSFGHKFKILLDDIKTLQARVGISQAAAASAESPSPADPRGGGSAVTVTSRDGRKQLLPMPAAVWRLSGALGRVLLPSPCLTSLAVYENGLQKATSLYGDQFVGRLAPDELRLPPGDARSPALQLTLSRQQRLDFAAPRFGLPKGWLLWRLSSGDAFAARFADEMLAVQTDAQPVELPTDDVAAVLRQGKALCWVRRNDTMLVGQPASGKVRAVLLVNGMRYEVPWRLVDSVGTEQPAVSAPAAATAAAPAPAPAAGPGSAVARLLRPGEGAPRQPRAVPDNMVLLPGATFSMGRSRGEGLRDELPPHHVQLRAFYMDPCEVTKGEFARFVLATRHKTDAERAGLDATWENPGFLQRVDEPVVCVSWYDAARYCNWRSEQADLQPCYEFAWRGEDATCHADRSGYRLPTEAEWEYAARSGGEDVLYPWGDESDPARVINLANFRQGDGRPQDRWVWTNPVRALPPGRAGLYGMGGNAWEWCEDWYFDQAYAAVHPQKPSDPCVRAADVAGLTRKVLRGGSFDGELDLLRCAARGHGTALASASRVGFRCVRNAR